MATNHDQQQAEEIRIIEAFLLVAQMPCQPDNIQSLNPPEPDILCTLEDGAQLAFELTEVIDPKQARNYNFSIDVRHAMYQYHIDMEPIKRAQMALLFSNAALSITFVKGTTFNKAVNLLPSLFDALLTCTSETEGNIDKDQIPKGIKRITVTRGEGLKGPFFNASGLALYIRNMMTERINQKFSKKYKCDCPMDLLVHGRLKPLPPDTLWLDEVRNLVLSNIHKSPFHRVWIFDYIQSNIRYVYPDV